MLHTFLLTLDHGVQWWQHVDSAYSIPSLNAHPHVAPIAPTSAPRVADDPKGRGQARSVGVRANNEVTNHEHRVVEAVGVAGVVTVHKPLQGEENDKGIG